MEHSSQRTKDPWELLVFHQALGVFPRCLRYNYCTAKMASNISPIFTLSSSVHPLRPDRKIIWSMIEWSNGSYGICINRIYEFSPNILKYVFLIWVKKSWFWHFESFCGSLISGLQEHPSGQQILWSLIFWCHNGFMIWFLIALQLCISGCCFPFFCWSGIALLFNYLPPGSAGKTATLQSPAAPGESIPCWDHPLLAWVGDERNSDR